MNQLIGQVLTGERRWAVEQADAIAWLDSLPADSIDLLVSSPPYERARLYLENGDDMGIARDTDQWVAWMVEVVRSAVRVCRGLVAFVVEGQTRQFRYSCGPLLLAADLCRAGFNLRRPAVFHRVGIPGSGGPDWLRNDWEPIICVTRPGRLPWSDNTALGHPPKWAPGGAMSHRVASGDRVNQWGHSLDSPTCAARQADGSKDKRKRPSHVGDKLRTNGSSPKDSCIGRRVPAGTTVNGVLLHEDAYLPPTLANPGNLIQQTYTADEVAQLLAEANDVIHRNVGGGCMGSDLAHENEAPFPQSLADFFVRSFCQPNGIVADPFGGSGTTGAASIVAGRRYIGCDLRESQVTLSCRRLQDVQPEMFLE